MKFLVKILIAAGLVSFAAANTFTDDFFKITNVDTRKREFIKRMYPLVKNANNAILSERKLVDEFFAQYKKTRSLSRMDKQLVDKMTALANKYDIKSIVNERLFKRRVAAVPPSLALTQAAIETGWGTSRFFKEGFNAFGQWTYNQSNGMVPESREEGKTHRVRTFSSVQASVDAYMLNLNRNIAYNEFRDMRIMMGVHFNGLNACAAMINYSQRREKYVTLLREIMIDNKLSRYDYLAM